MWVASKIRERFGLAAATGFVVPVAFEPMFTALAPNLYWAVGLWFVPMAIAMDIAGAESRKRRWWLIVATGAAVFAKSLCGYEFVTTVIVAAMIGCLLNTRDDRGYPFQNIIDMVWVALAGVTGFVLAILVHGAKLGFAVILDRAIDRTSGGGSAVDQGLNIGQFASISSVIRTYLGANDYTQIRNFGLLLGLLGVIAVAAFLDREYGWFLGEDRRRLSHAGLRLARFARRAVVLVHSCQGACLCASAARFHPLACADRADRRRDGRSRTSARPSRRERTGRPRTSDLSSRSQFRRSSCSLRPSSLSLDWRIEKSGTWVLEAHARGVPVFADKDIGVDLRMSDKWFTLDYACDRASPTDVFFIRAINGEADRSYEFHLWERAVSVPGDRNCYYAQAREGGPVSRLEFGLRRNRQIVWQREAMPAAAR